MVKFLIFALVALPICFSKLLLNPNWRKDEVEYYLKEYFDLTPEDLKEECNVDFQRAWRKIGAAALSKFDEIYLDLYGKGPGYAKPDVDEFNKRYLAKCHKSKPYKKAVMNVIKTALPCAEKDSLDKHFEAVKPRVCHKF